MAPRNKDNDIGLAPDAPVRADYGRDFYSWLIEQAGFVREGRWDALDRDNLAEEIESLGREQFNKLVGAPRVLMRHMLKWDHQPDMRSRRWVLSIKPQREDLADVLADNPGLKPRIAEAQERAYRRARIEAPRKPDWMKRRFLRRARVRSRTSHRVHFPFDVFPLMSPPAVTMNCRHLREFVCAPAGSDARDRPTKLTKNATLAGY